MSRIGAVAIFFLALGVFVTLLFKSPESQRTERNEPDGGGSKFTDLEKKIASLQSENETLRKRSYDVTPKATPEDLAGARAARKTFDWLKKLDPKRFKWLGFFQMLTLRELDLSRMTRRLCRSTMRPGIAKRDRPAATSAMSQS